VLEVGPGMGILSDILLQQKAYETHLIDIDTESFNFLQKKYPQLGDKLINGDFLQLNFADVFPGKFAIIGNFPYTVTEPNLPKGDARQTIIGNEIEAAIAVKKSPQQALIDATAAIKGLFVAKK
jgi:16S rRNA A1518/A1519 N6-dimethyltransferase RsmA/KsgA/DIM1 with predicted DNA glycosylase/AP lyase activity